MTITVYGMKMLLPMGCRPDGSGWAKLTEFHILGDYRHELRLGWSDRIAKRRPEISQLINQFGGGVG
jgi:hypothetical protein